MALPKFSLRTRIFIAMIFLVIIASLLIAIVTISQYNNETQAYHDKRLSRKEENIKDHIKILLNKKQNELENISTKQLQESFETSLYDISVVHKMELNMYDLDGQFIKSSKAIFNIDDTHGPLTESILNELKLTAEHRYVSKHFETGESYLSSYSYIYDNRNNPIAILNLPYLENNDFLQKELQLLLTNLSYAYVLMLIIAVVIAYFLSKYITKSLKTINDVLRTTRLETRNQKIEVSSSSIEISTLVNSYNKMIDELEESAVILAKSEREQAWREMAKQVAHEIKNPLTPMRLTVQSFENKFDPSDPGVKLKLKEYSKTLIQQIDTMSSIASAFSSFANLPEQKKEQLDLVETVRLALDIFNEPYISFVTNSNCILLMFDRTQMIRVITNLVKNAIQSIPENQEEKKIEVILEENLNEVTLSVTDNGHGISEKNKLRVFEPKFTTKTSGMGLGLPMVKNIIETYKGTISFKSSEEEGTTFNLVFPKEL